VRALRDVEVPARVRAVVRVTGGEPVPVTPEEVRRSALLFGVSPDVAERMAEQWAEDQAVPGLEKYQTQLLWAGRNAEPAFVW